ncbi:MAG TPA: alpha/beta hydrolase [Steroidobacteraceae bacterium]|nr:alpha/beta hydrolase [Steroidobacteraceae bacterium]
MAAPELETLDVESGPNPVASIIWMHGLGADAHDFEPIVPEVAAALGRPLRFVFPNAPVRPVTVNSGYPMRAWFDIKVLGGSSIAPDEPGIRESAAAIRALIRRENEHGVPTSRILLGGFSQGAAMAAYTGVRHSGRLAGIVGLSAFPLLTATLDAERQAANRETPIFLAHGTMDPMVDVRLGEQLRDELKSRGYEVEWRSYPMQHTVSMEELRDMAAWLKRTASVPTVAERRRSHE